MLAHAMQLPTFEVAGMALLKRVTMNTDGRIEAAFYPVVPSGRSAGDVIAWLRQRTAA